MGEGRVGPSLGEEDLVARHRGQGLTDFGAGGGCAGASVAKAAARMEASPIPRCLRWKLLIKVFSGTATLSLAIVQQGVQACIGCARWRGRRHFEGRRASAHLPSPKTPAVRRHLVRDALRDLQQSEKTRRDRSGRIARRHRRFAVRHAWSVREGCFESRWCK